jgi:hypothetical protein
MKQTRRVGRVVLPARTAGAALAAKQSQRPPGAESSAPAVLDEGRGQTIFRYLTK